MAKENKSTTIMLLVIAGALLFLIGSFTGNAFGFGKTVGEGQSCSSFIRCTSGLSCVNAICTKPVTTPIPTQPTTGLTTQDVLSMLKNKCYIAQFDETLLYSHFGKSDSNLNLIGNSWSNSQSLSSSQGMQVSGNALCAKSDPSYSCFFTEVIDNKDPYYLLNNGIIECNHIFGIIGNDYNFNYKLRMLCCKV